MKRTAEDAAKTRRALLEAALFAFAAKGWRGATFAQVAERAGVTRGALHHHFASKAALLGEALEWGWAAYGDRLFAAESGPADAGAWLTGLLVEFVTLLHRDARFRALASTTVVVAPQAAGDSADDSAGTSTGKDAALDGWRDRIAARIGDTREHVPAGTAAGLVLVLLQGFTVTAVTRPTDLPQPDELGAAMAALVRGLLSEKDA